MNNISQLLTSTIINLELYKNDIIRKDVDFQRLCYCRKKLLENFTSTAQHIFIQVASNLLIILNDNTKFETSYILDFYYQKNYTEILTNNMISPKMLLVYKTIQQPYDKLLEDILRIGFEDILVEDADLDFKIKNLFSLMFDLIEKHLLNIISIKIDCLKLNDTLLTDNNLVDNFNCESIDSCQNKLCLICNKDKSKSEWHDEYYKNEEFHIFLDDEFNSSLIQYYYDFLLKYHTNVKNITIIFDRELLENKNIDYLNNCIEFGNIHFGNVEIR